MQSETLESASFMNLTDKQQKFAIMTSHLIRWCWFSDIRVTYGETFRPKETCELYAKQGRGIANSLHNIRLAVDFNAFIAGEYQVGPEPYDKMHDYWDSIGGAARIEDDLGHFSLEHEGVR
jgi:hypothetical protein